MCFTINSAERKQNRRTRREDQRKKKRDEFMENIDTMDALTDPDHLINAFNHAKNGVLWKPSVQRYLVDLMKNTVRLSKDIEEGKPVGRGFYRFNVFERGKPREIKSVCIKERVAQRALCDYVLIPTFTRTLIYDNGASLKNKGISFAFKRMKKHLTDYYKKHGNSGYVLQFDFSSYFANIDHECVRILVEKSFEDEKLREFIMKFVNAFEEGGLGLGSEISQIIAIAYPNAIDHYIKEVLKIKYYGRYMDDLYLIHPDKEYLKYCLSQILRMADDLHIIINKKKTRIVPLKNGVSFLKTLFIFTNTGKILTKPTRSSVVRQRRKMKKFKKMYKNNEITLKQIQQSYNSWRGYIIHKDSRRSVYNMDKLVRRLFGTNFYEKKKHNPSSSNIQQNTPAPSKRKYSPMELECIKYQMRLDAIMMEMHKHKPGSQEFIDLTNEKLSLEKRTRRLTDKIIKQKAREIVQQNIDIINNERK